MPWQGGRVDLRSEIVARPTPEMWEVMQGAEIGWPQRGDDRNVNELERRGAELTGMEAAVYVFTASIANLLALIVGTQRGDQAIFEADSHMVWIEGWNLAYIGGLYPRLIKSETGSLPIVEVEKVLEEWRGPAHPRTSLIALESPHNDHGGTIVPAEDIRALAALAHSHKSHIHMDGARIHNAAVATGLPVRRFTEDLDTVTVSLNKGLGAPLGALLCGSAEAVDTARHKGLKWLGASGMHRGGLWAAAGLYALDHMVDRLAEDHRRARLIADSIRGMPGIEVNHPQTNQVRISTAPGGRPAKDYVDALTREGLLTTLREPHAFKLMTHHEINDDATDEAIRIARAVVGKLSTVAVG
jgi:threonine aldolase